MGFYIALDPFRPPGYVGAHEDIAICQNTGHIFSCPADKVIPAKLRIFPSQEVGTGGDDRKLRIIPVGTDKVQINTQILFVQQKFAVIQRSADLLFWTALSPMLIRLAGTFLNVAILTLRFYRRMLTKVVLLLLL